MDGFCNNEPFWDTDLTWHGDWPQFTGCFQHTALAWGSCGYLWVTALFYLLYLTGKARRPLPFTPAFIFKLFTCGVLFVLRVVQAFHALETSSQFNAELSDYVIHMATYILLAVLLVMEKQRAVITSPVLFFFWLFSLLVNIIPFYSKIILRENEQDVFGFGVFYIVYGFTMAGFLSSCFAETIPPGSYNTNGNLEVSASVLSRITFWWTNGMLIKGYRGLQDEHLVPLNPRDKTAATVPVLQRNLEREENRVHNQETQRQCLESSFYYQSKKQQLLSNGDHNVSTNNDETTALLKAEKNHSFSYTSGAKPHSGATGSSDADKKRGHVSMYRVVFKTFWWQLVCSNSLNVVQTVAVLVSPIIMRAMIQFTEGSDPDWKGYVYAVGLCVLSGLQSVSQHVCLFYTTNLALRLSSSLTAAVYRKALTMNSEARRESTVGEIVNLMSVDARNLEMYTTYSFWLWMSPIWIIVALYLLYDTVGVSMFAGLGFMALLFGVNTILGNKLIAYQKAIMTIRDKRVKVINEILNGIKILKLYAWEPSYERKVAEIRDEELGVLLKSSFIDSFVTFAWTAALYWMTLFTFMTYVYVDDSHNLDASTSFVALSYFNTIRTAVNVMPIMIREGIKSYVSMGRINKFINTPDLDTSNTSRGPSSENAIEITDATFSWDKEVSPVLKDIEVKVARGSLVAVVGQVGAGKSSLVSAMLGEMETVSGHVHVSGSIAYVPQQAWIQNDSLRNNVLFGRDLDQQRYDKVIDACALRPDLDILAGGDMTEIGEKGINLSGGQKQRVSVARAVYSDSDVILLDDPLSAVDSHVGKHIFKEVIDKGGMLSGKTRVLVTHGLQWLPRADSIVVLSEGGISEMGSYEELMSHDGAFAHYLTTYLTQHHDQEDEESEDEEAQSVKRDILQRLVSRESENESGGDAEITKGRMLQRLKSLEPDTADGLDARRRRKRSRGESESSLVRSGRGARHDKEKATVAKDKDVSKLIEEEEVESGRVSSGVYLELARALGYKYSLVMLGLYSVYNVAALGGNLWLSQWSDNTELNNVTALPSDSARRQDLNDFYLGIYAALGVAQTVFVVIYGVIMAFRHIHASRLLHARMLQGILRAPMAFFDTTPFGRIVNRFSQDMDMLDSEICFSLEIWVDNVEKVLSTVIAISYTTPIFLAVFAPAAFIYYFIMRFYIGTSCQIRRLQSKKRSPIYSHFGESITGAHVIRAYAAQRRFVRQSEDRVDALLECSYNTNAANRWLGIRLDFVGTLLILAAGIFTVLSRDTLSAGIVGLSLSYALQVTGEMNMVVRMSTDLETNIVSVERIAEYTRVKSEAPWSAIPRPKPDWPQRGDVSFHGYSTRYRPGLDLVIRDLTCDFKAGEKVAIVGRTGAGKSSLTLALFRLIEPAAGYVTIDDVNVATLGLHDLRDKLNILPQDPVIFDGSVRSNLDPLGAHSEDAIWRALEQAHMKNYVTALPKGLDNLCGEGGDNLSVGQRQLVCLARALLRQTKVLVLDEATAAVDLQTDDLIQTTIRRAFAHCTVITIAHRINTVMDYDRIMVLDNGRMVECDSPARLLSNPNSAFYSMAKDAGLV